MKNNFLVLICLAQLNFCFAQKQLWRSLVTGKDLSGFTQIGGKAVYTVQNGVIIGQTVADTPNSFLCTNEKFDDFILELEVKVAEGMNSGIQFRSNSIPDFNNGVYHGYQCEIDPTDRAWSGGVYDESRRGWLYIPTINTKSKTAFKRNQQWNKYRIEAIGPVIKTWLNDVPISCLIDDMTGNGTIGLQVHSIAKNQVPGQTIHWRNIRIQTGKNMVPKAWDNTPVVNLLNNNLSEIEKAQGFKLLFNGTDFDGWRSVFSDKMTGKSWKVENGEMKVIPTDGSETGNDIVTTEQFGAFELLFDFKLSAGANSGVKYFVDEKIPTNGKSGIGLEFQILDDALHPDAKLGAAGNRTLASLYDLIPSYKLEARFNRPVDSWNQGRIVVLPNNTVQHWLNGFKVIEYERKSNIFDALVARSKYKDFAGFGYAEKGPILLQDHGNKVAFKNVKIRVLK